jgi:hypothetical protein
MVNNFKKDVKDYLKRLEKGINKTKQNLAQGALKTLVKESPIWGGAYIKSHKVGIDEIDTHHEPVWTLTKFGPRLPHSAMQALRAEMATKLSVKILASDFNDTLYISNSIPYADQVEYIGWGKAGPHHPFGKAKMAIKAKTFLKSKTNAPIGI